MRGRLAVTPRRRDEEKASGTSDFRCHGVPWPRGDLAYEQIPQSLKIALRETRSLECGLDIHIEIDDVRNKLACAWLD
jgi:hypothetical protein